MKQGTVIRGFGWKLISSPVLQSSIQDIAYLLVHNKLPLPRMLFRVGAKNDPYCGVCDGAQFQDMTQRLFGCWAFTGLKFGN